jgi:hypothetical protein
MRHNVAYTFTAKERNLLGDLLLKKMDEIASKYDHDIDRMVGKDKDDYMELYNLYIQF